MTKTTGGPAFPNPEKSFEEFGYEGFYPGMTIRDYFAAKAMAALLVGIKKGEENQITLLPAVAYGVADAMLAEREK